MTNVGFKHLVDGQPFLRTLKCSVAVDDATRQLSIISDFLLELRTLVLCPSANSVVLNDDAFDSIPNLQNLTHLDIRRHSSLTSGAMRQIVKLPRLRQLNVFGIPHIDVDDDALKQELRHVRMR